MQLLGPLAQLAGEWEGDQGVDVAFSHARGEISETPYREVATFKPFGPVDNGTQSLYGLDYKMTAWRIGEDVPFHTELGYWLYCAQLGEVMRSFMVPRGTVVLAGGKVTPEETTYTLSADVGTETYGILSNPYLALQARTTHYECTVTLDGDTFTYSSDTVIELARTGETIHHTDRNTLRRTAAYELAA
jgi:hypothetical protein